MHEAIRKETLRESRRTEKRITLLKNSLASEQPPLSSGAKIGLRTVVSLFLSFVNSNQSSEVLFLLFLPFVFLDVIFLLCLQFLNTTIEMLEGIICEYQALSLADGPSFSPDIGELFPLCLPSAFVLTFLPPPCSRRFKAYVRLLRFDRSCRKK
jgi:hypothetical protein